MRFFAKLRAQRRHLMSLIMRPRSRRWPHSLKLLALRTTKPPFLSPTPSISPSALMCAERAGPTRARDIIFCEEREEEYSLVENILSLSPVQHTVQHIDGDVKRRLFMDKAHKLKHTHVHTTYTHAHTHSTHDTHAHIGMKHPHTCILHEVVHTDGAVFGS